MAFTGETLPDDEWLNQTAPRPTAWPVAEDTPGADYDVFAGPFDPTERPRY
jgi:hypothetical protein